MPRDLPRIASRLESLGLAPLIYQLLSGPLTEQKEYNFGTLTTAKQVQALLYNWMFFYPEIKTRTSLRLNMETATLYITPRSLSEKRGRKKLQ
jgi:hypothetical protein